MGVAAFRLEKHEACAKLIEQFEAINEHFHEASTLLVDAAKIGTNEKLNAFLIARSKAYELMLKAKTQDMEIIRVTLDESIVDLSAVVEKIKSLAASRNAYVIAANEATDASDAIVKKE